MSQKSKIKPSVSDPDPGSVKSAKSVGEKTGKKRENSS
jgi:hypothetical protein